MLKPKLLSQKALRFDFEIFVRGTAICAGHITQVSINKQYWKASAMPQAIQDKIKTLSESKNPRIKLKRRAQQGKRR